MAVQKHVWYITVNWHTNQWTSRKKLLFCTDDHQFAKDDLETVGELADPCAQVVFDMCILCTNRWTRYVMDSQRTGSSSHKME